MPPPKNRLPPEFWSLKLILPRIASLTPGLRVFVWQLQSRLWSERARMHTCACTGQT